MPDPVLVARSRLAHAVQKHRPPEEIAAARAALADAKLAREVDTVLASGAATSSALRREGSRLRNLADFRALL